ncbi:MAG: DUF4864 domain-containing protein [Proteobacteria bacterium]|nr:DUF4864 domain-containing protein [Pseudomonadota bacterium]MDA1309866.1 DUF4864 domain-containing protein [Pseudomonadota bacterium]
MRRHVLRLFSGFFLFFLIGLPAPTLAASSLDTEEAARIRSVIQKQLDAFQRDNWTEAFSYAAPFLQEQFGSPDRFRRMVLGGYAIVHRPRTTTFKGLEEIGGRLAQKVFMVGPDGKAAMVVYFMEKQANGIWRIGGVSIIPLADQSA